MVAGKYHLLREVGEGGMAVVWRAEMRGAAGFARPVAVKKMKPELLRGQVYAAMFVEEARVGSELAHPNVVQVFDFCQDDDGLYCLVMEWVEGLDLRAFIRFFPPAQAPDRLAAGGGHRGGGAARAGRGPRADHPHRGVGAGDPPGRLALEHPAGDQRCW